MVLASTLLAGCGPSNFDDCRTEAAKMPTESGVRLAAMDCQRKFPQLQPFSGQLDAAQPEKPTE